MTPARRDSGLFRGRRWRSLANDGATWLLALLLAIGLWFFVNAGSKTSERTLRVRLDLAGLPAGMVITNPVPEYVEIRAIGSGLLLSSIDAKDLRAALDLSGVRPGVATFTLHSRNFSLPRSVDVTRVTPSQVSLQVDRLLRRSVPVRLETRNELEPGLSLTQSSVLPETVEVTGPRSAVAVLPAVETQPVDLAPLPAGVTDREVDLVYPGGLMQIRLPRVRVHLVVDRELAERSFAGVPLELRNAAPGLEAVPAEVRVVVAGPRDELGGLELRPGAAYIDATDLSEPGPHRVRPEVALPPGYRVVRVEPPVVEVRLKRSREGTDRRDDTPR
jgi:YbbR domain-containing protein